ncbi:putative NADP-dependent oxidoreductase [Escovopsis weberi]|uniref:Dehydrogenase FUB6 n=1 Tax=Escovopsis weberi TaxID=150374 RepID=A0A0M8N1W3_ESCWE|nr:putative NADP-dependent oxidoreductase [Escovopsis weberi]
MADTMRTVVLAERPVGDIIPGQTFNVKLVPKPTADQLKEGEILVEALYLSLDPAMRGWLQDVRSYLPPVQIGAVMRGATVSRVVASRSSLAAVGDHVYAQTGWVEHAILREGQFEPPSTYPSGTKPKDMISLLGLTGLTAWVGMTKIGQPKAGDTVVVSGAAGATGSVAGQIAKLNGARVIGIAGGAEKCKWLTEELGFDVALDYKAPDFAEKFQEATPNFIDVYFDNVGGEILNMCLQRAKEHARFVMCGGISQYNAAKPQGPSAISRVVTMRIRMQGFIVFDHAADFPKGRAELAQWAAEGKIRGVEHVLPGGLEAADVGLIGLFKGINTGKMLVEVKNPADSKL